MIHKFLNMMLSITLFNQIATAQFSTRCIEASEQYVGTKSLRLLRGKSNDYDENENDIFDRQEGEEIAGDSNFGTGGVSNSDELASSLSQNKDHMRLFAIKACTNEESNLLQGIQLVLKQSEDEVSIGNFTHASFQFKKLNPNFDPV